MPCITGAIVLASTATQSPLPLGFSLIKVKQNATFSPRHKTHLACSHISTSTYQVLPVFNVHPIQSRYRKIITHAIPYITTLAVAYAVLAVYHPHCLTLPKIGGYKPADFSRYRLSWIVARSLIKGKHNPRLALLFRLYYFICSVFFGGIPSTCYHYSMLAFLSQ